MRAIAKLWLFLALTLAIACKKKVIEQMIPYNGPLIEVDTVETLYSDSAILRVKLNAPKQYEYQTGDREYPKGIDIVFFNEKGVKSSTLVADKGYYDKAKDIYTVTGNVEIKNLLEAKKLNTEQLHWNPSVDKIYADSNIFVRIETPTEILTGKGMVTNQNFTKYKFKGPVGSFTVQETP